MQLKDHHVRYLSRTARRLSSRLGRTVKPGEVLQALVDMAIADEATYDPEDSGRLITEGRREIVQAERASRTTDLAPDELLKWVASQAGVKVTP